MEDLTREEKVIAKCCVLAEIRMQQEDLKELVGMDETVRRDKIREIEKLRAIVKKLEA